MFLSLSLLFFFFLSLACLVLTCLLSTSASCLVFVLFLSVLVLSCRVFLVLVDGIRLCLFLPFSCLVLPCLLSCFVCPCRVLPCLLYCRALCLILSCPYRECRLCNLDHAIQLQGRPVQRPEEDDGVAGRSSCLSCFAYSPSI